MLRNRKLMREAGLSNTIVQSGAFTVSLLCQLPVTFAPMNARE